jgi:DNA-directed RNA polymerase specialized sigma24 family protein
MSWVKRLRPRPTAPAVEVHSHTIGGRSTESAGTVTGAGMAGNCLSNNTMDMDDAIPPTEKWVLTREAFERLLAWLDPDRERAGQKYEKIRQKLVKFFEFHGCASPEECADVTLDRVARKISEGEEIHASDPYLYFHGVARNVFKEYLRESKRQPVGLDGLRSAPPADTEHSEQRLTCLSQCLEKLSLERREFILRFYQGERRAKIENRKKLAEERGVSLNALRIRAHRIRVGLEKCVEECLKKRSAG